MIAFADFLSDDLALSNICPSTISSYRKKIALYILRRRIPSYEKEIIDNDRSKKLHDVLHAQLAMIKNYKQ